MMDDGYMNSGVGIGTAPPAVPAMPTQNMAPVNPMRDIMRDQLIASLMQRGMRGRPPLQGASTPANNAFSDMMMQGQ